MKKQQQSVHCSFIRFLCSFSYQKIFTGKRDRKSGFMQLHAAHIFP